MEHFMGKASALSFREGVGGSRSGLGRPREPDGLGTSMFGHAQKGGGLVDSTSVSVEVASP